MQALHTIKQKMPFLLALSSDERRALPQPGDRGRAFITKAMEVATQNPDILPGVFDLPEMRKDVELTNALQPIIMALSQLQGMMDVAGGDLGGIRRCPERLQLCQSERQRGGDGERGGGVGTLVCAPQCRRCIQGYPMMDGEGI